MAGGEDFACRGDTVPIAHQFQGDGEERPHRRELQPLLKGDRKGSPLRVGSALDHGKGIWVWRELELS